MLRSISWNIFGSAALVLVNVLFGILLARSIAPVHFGTFALIVALPSILNAFLYFVLKNHLIQSIDGIEQVKALGIFYRKILRGIHALLLVLATLFFLFQNYHTDVIISILLVILGLECFGFWASKQIGLELSGDFKSINQLRLIAGLLSNFTALVMAFHGFGLLALATRYVLNYLLLFLLYQPIHFQGEIQLHPVRLLNDFKTIGVYQSLEILMRYLDDILIGVLMGAVPLAYYTKSYQIFSRPSELITNKTFEAILPRIFDLRKPYRILLLSKVFLHLQTILTPILIFIFFYAEELVILLLGNNWAPARVAIQWFSLANIVNYHILYSNVLIGIEENELLRSLGSLKNLLLLIAIIIGCFFNLETLVQFFFITTLFSSLYFLIYFTEHKIFSLNLSLDLFFRPALTAIISYLIFECIPILSNPENFIAPILGLVFLMICIALFLRRDVLRTWHMLVKLGDEA